MYTKSKTKAQDESEFKKKVMAQKPATNNGGSKASLTNIQSNNDKGDKNQKDDGKKQQNDKNQAGGKDNRKGSLDNKNQKEKKKRIVYVEENTEDSDEEIVIVKKKKGRGDSIDAQKRGRSPKGDENDKNDKNKQLQKDKLKKRAISIPTFKTKKKVEEKKPDPPKKDKDPYILVTEFYLGQYKAPICGADIFEMFEWQGQYAHLDINHAYFHWLFPHFQGPFGKERATLFRQNAVIGGRIIQSYKLILDFYGIQLDNEATGDVSRADNCLSRYKETFLKPYTNHEFRVKRMLQFLNVTGYRIYAIQLVKFLEKEIFKYGKSQAPPLKSLEQVYQVEWKPYGEVDEKDKKALDSVAQKCLFSYEVLTQELNSHLQTLIY